MVRTSLFLAVVGALGLVFVGLRSDAEDRPAADGAVEARYRETVRPFLETHCLRCHGPEKPKGDMDLSPFTDAPAAAKDLPRWALVLEQLEAGTMPLPKARPQPTAEARAAVIDWIGALRKQEAEKHAGDPGPVASVG